MFLIFFLIFVIRACISRFKDCPLCGADIKKIEPDDNLQGIVDRFIEGHARIKRSISSDKGEAAEESKPVIYEDVSLERGSFLVQQAMRVSMAFSKIPAKLHTPLLWRIKWDSLEFLLIIETIDYKVGKDNKFLSSYNS